MAYFNKAGLLILSDDKTRFLTVEKDNFTTDFLFPGGRYEGDENDEGCLCREIKEELNCELDPTTLQFINEYHGPAAGDYSKDIKLRLFHGNIVGEPVASSEIVNLHWLSREDADNPRVSLLIRTHILPDLLEKKLLK